MWKYAKTTRQQLYAEVWAEPMIHVAKRYGVSGRGLGKVCDRHDIPVPPRGWWAKKAHGHKVRPTPLPPASTTLDRITFQVTGAERLAENQEAPEYLREKEPAWRIDVPEDLALSHPLIQSTEKALQKAAKVKPEAYGRFQDRYQRLLLHAGPGQLAISVSAPLIPRALRLMQALLTAFDKRGYEVTVTNEGTFVSVLDEKYAISISELFRQKTVTNRWGNSVEIEPAGRLRVRFGERYSGSELSDKPAGPKVETRLNRFIAGLVRRSIQTKTDRAIYQDRQRRWRDFDEKQRVQRQKRNTELLRRKHLEKLAVQWSRFDRLRVFVAAVEEHVANGRQGQPAAKELLSRAKAFVAENDPVEAFLMKPWPKAALPAKSEMPWDWEREQ